jgi:hypothetical protein
LPLLCSLTSSFSPNPSQRPPSCNLLLSSSSSGEHNENNGDSTSFSSSSSEYRGVGGSSSPSRRREVLSVISGAVAWAVPAIAQAGLLDDFGSDPSKIETVKKAPAAPVVAASTGAPKTDRVGNDPTLKGCKCNPKKEERKKIGTVQNYILSWSEII